MSLNTILGRLFQKPERIGDVETLIRFLDSRSAFLAQKGIVEFCRVRAGVYWQKLFSEQEFLDALTHSCWEAYAPCLAMVSEMVEATLRETAGAERNRVAAGLLASARAAYESHPLPTGFAQEEWNSRFNLVAGRMDEVRGAATRPVREMPDPMARLVFDRLPIHPQIVTNDYDYIYNNLRMGLLRAHDDFLDAADRDALVAGLSG